MKNANLKQTLARFVGEELAGWKKAEVIWLLFACLMITGISLYWGDTLMGIISSVCGVACVVLTGKGKLSAYLFGTVNVILYAIIAFKATYYGETLLNLIYYLPMEFIGFYLWSKNMNSQTHEVKKRHMKNKWRILVLLGIIAGTVGLGILLQNFGDAMPFVDALTTVSSIFAMLISVKMFAEQWWIWIVVDIFTIIMWLRNFLVGNSDIATLLMWTVYLVNAVIMCVKWEKEAKRNHNAV